MQMQSALYEFEAIMNEVLAAFVLGICHLLFALCVKDSFWFDYEGIYKISQKAHCSLSNKTTAHHTAATKYFQTNINCSKHGALSHTQ